MSVIPLNSPADLHCQVRVSHETPVLMPGGGMPCTILQLRHCVDALYLSVKFADLETRNRFLSITEAKAMPDHETRDRVQSNVAIEALRSRLLQERADVGKLKTAIIEHDQERTRLVGELNVSDKNVETILKAIATLNAEG